MNEIEEKLFQFDVVTAHIYNMQNKGKEVQLPAFMDFNGFEKAKREALYLNQVGRLGDLYKRILTNAI